MTANPDYRPAATLIVLLGCVAPGAASLVPFYTVGYKVNANPTGGGTDALCDLRHIQRKPARPVAACIRTRPAGRYPGRGHRDADRAPLRQAGAVNLNG